MIAHHATAADYQTFVAANGVHLVIIYREWFPDQIPEAWLHVGTLSLAGETISAAEKDVQFYATDRDTAARVANELHAFRPSLPPGVKLTLD